MCHIPMHTSKISSITKSHKNWKSYWLPKNTVQLPFVSGVGSNGILTIYVHASFSVHPESNSYIGTCTTLVHGSMLSLSSKQKNNGKSSSKARLIGVDNTIMIGILMQHFYIAV